jgi:hypothetical protein
MPSLLKARLIAVAAMIAVPAALALARSDTGTWTSLAEQQFLSIPFGYFAFACTSFAIILGLASGVYSVLRTLAVAAVCAGLAYATPIVAWPILFALGEGCEPVLAALFLMILAIPAGLAQALLLPCRETSRRWQVLAHALVMCGVCLLVLPLRNTHCGIASKVQFDFFQNWPIIFAVAPYVALLTRERLAAQSWRLAAIFILAIAPLYATKAMLDYHAGFGRLAAVWPVRVWKDFAGFDEREQRRKQLVKILPNVPSRIGENIYKFARFESQWDMPVANPPRQSDRISGTILLVPIEDLGLPELVSPANPTTITLFIVSDGRQQGAPLVPRDTAQTFVSNVRYRDLTITFALRRSGDYDPNEVGKGILAFMERSLAN